MRSFPVAAIVLILLGVAILSIHSVTYFTHEAVAGPLGFFAWDVARPHTIFVNPLAGIIAIAIGIVLALAPRRQAAL